MFVRFGMFALSLARMDLPVNYLMLDVAMSKGAVCIQAVSLTSASPGTPVY